MAKRPEEEQVAPASLLGVPGYTEQPQVGDGQTPAQLVGAGNFEPTSPTPSAILRSQEPSFTDQAAALAGVPGFQDQSPNAGTETPEQLIGVDGFSQKDESISMPTPEQLVGTEPETAGTEQYTQNLLVESRRAKAKAEKERVDAILTERARMRRGLPPLNKEARDAVVGGPDAMKAYRAGPQRATGVGELSQMPAVYKNGQLQPPGTTGVSGAAGGVAAQQQPQTSGYQTGQTVQLQNIPGGQQSTTVYALDNGVALPDGQGMSTEDFGAAFEQLNPGKTKMDAIQALAREPGPSGNAARKLLRDAGATGGQALTQAQQDQIEAQLGSRADELLRTHARSMQTGITAGSQRIAKRQEEEAKLQQKMLEDEQKRQEEIRKAAMKSAEAKYGTDEFAGRSFDSILQDEIEYESSKQQFITGAGQAPVRPIDTGNVFDVPSYEVRPDSVPSSAMPDGGYIDPQSGLLQYQNEQLQAPLPAALIDAPGREGGKQVVPIVQNDRQVGTLPPGQSYILNGKLYFKGTPGRPTKEAKEAPSKPKGKPEAIEIDASKVEQDLLREKSSPIESAMRSTQGEIDRYTETLKNITDPATKTEVQNIIDGLNKELQSQQESLRESQVVTNEEIIAEMNRRKARHEELQTLQQNWMFGQGDPETVTTVTNAALPEVKTEVMTRGGSVLDIDGVQVPYTTDSNGAIVIDASSPEQILAIEQNAQGNVVTKAMGDNAVSAVASQQYRETSDLMSEIQKTKQENSLVMVNGSPSDQRQLIDRLKQYLTVKYNPDQRDMPRLIDGMLEGLGFEAPTADILAHQQRAQEDRGRIAEAEATRAGAERRAELEAENSERNKNIFRRFGDFLNADSGGGFSPND